FHAAEACGSWDGGRDRARRFAFAPGDDHDRRAVQIRDDRGTGAIRFDARRSSAPCGGVPDLRFGDRLVDLDAAPTDIAAAIEVDGDAPRGVAARDAAGARI